MLCRTAGVTVVLLWLACAGAGLAREAGLTLVAQGQPTATIVLAPQPTRVAQFAAAELQYHLRQMTGATVPIASDRPATGTAILVGESPATTALGLASKDFAPQEYLVGFRPNALVLMGHDRDERGLCDYQNAETFPGDFDEQGSVYAVYDFLERCCDVRWYLPTALGEVIPRRQTLTVAGTDVRRRPAMIYRVTYASENVPADLIGDTLDHPEGASMLNRRDARLYLRRMRQGGAQYNANHSFEGYPARFRKDHPDWFAQGAPEQDEYPQLCYTNPAVTQQVITDARSYFDTGVAPPRSVGAGDFYALVPMDSANWCQCARCQAEILEQPTRGRPNTSNNRASDYIFGFINRVAHEVGQSHPDKWLAALAYSQYVYPPTREPLAKNVSIMLCLQTRLMYRPEVVRNDQQILQAWTRESVERPKFVWLYFCYPTLWSVGSFRPFPGFFAHSLVKQWEQFERSGVRGFFIEPSYLAHAQRSPLLDQLELYLAYHMALDPAMDGNRAIAEFFTRYYGPAAAPMRALYEQMEAVYADPANHPGGVAPTELQAWHSLGTEARMREYARLLSQARRLARQGDAVYQQRVALFDKGVYRWMREGRDLHLRLTKLRGTEPPSADVPRVAAAAGDPERVDWNKAAVLDNWATLRGESTNRQVQARLAHDGTYLYVQLQETGINPAKLVLGAAITVWDEDEWEIFVARKRGGQHRQMGLNAAGVHYDLAYDEPSKDWDSGVILRSDVSAPDRWTVRMALPLSKLVVGGARAGDTLYFNALRATQMIKALSWSPTYGGFREPDRLGQIRLAK